MVDGKQKMYHLLQNDDLYQYLLDTSVYPREPDILKGLRDATSSHPLLRSVLEHADEADRRQEDHRSRCFHRLLSPRHRSDLARGWQGHRDRHQPQELRRRSAVYQEGWSEPQDRATRLEDPKNEGAFDFAFVDADKDNYANYHERLLKLVKVGGLIVYDNTLWGGTVTLPDVSLVFPDSRRRGWVELIELNKLLAKDPRIEISQIPLGDGMTLCKRLK